MTRVAVVDIGTNSTRLLVADVSGSGVEVLDRRSIVTRLGEGLEASGELGEAPRGRVFAVLDEYRAAIEEHGASVRTAVLTSAVRDASNGAEFTAAVRDDYGLDADTISGDEEAHLTFLGATTSRSVSAPVLVVDIGGGSTELVIGTGDGVDFHVSTQVGVVRHSERHLASDPPTDAELAALRDDAGATLREALPGEVPSEVVAVAGTATMAASMELGLEPYDPDRVEGYVLSIDALRSRLDQLASLPLQERVKTPGLHPDRAPTIVAGVAILIEILDAAGAASVTVSDRDLLYGRAIESARG
jgi:exopolyphosphatase/guanosine-5'-triphosphate,3'-diphosphate pyrophosphatase